MQFKIAFIASALLVAATAPAVLGADFVWFSDANCTGSVIARGPGIPPGECIYLDSPAKSISYSGVPNHAYFFQFGPARPVCSNGALIVTDGGSGCASAPAGFSIDGFTYS